MSIFFGVNKTENIQECAKFYSTLLRKKYIVTLENNITFSFYFKPVNFYHLIGLEKLKDISQIQNVDKVLVYKNIKSGKLSAKLIEKSYFYPDIEDRVRYFGNISKILDKNNSKIIIDFDPSIVPNTKLKNTEFLFLNHEKTGYSHLAIGKKTDYYPETFIYENSKRYISEQTLLDILDIEIIKN